ncbi:hypothetical protein B0A54_16978 [Friedmanniomyces endolithicus]|uniref:Ribonucleases P/MRP subunit Pop8-like domain-containing protein n=1 Tax=Friedmanniomyces endolithicus TaxID=329885 RepID=A0A4U0TWV2_9PEZI|nr:hypothetical protein LTS09_011451 [Friedmanniomyces endolithicus]TKA26913.1 hypothetical protein B0A54_16978 [Friedmanniomyces endolithicus]
MATDESLPDITVTTAVTERTTQPSTTTTTGPNKKTKKKRKRAPKTHILSQSTLRNPPWSYIHLQHLTAHSPATTTTALLDAVTAHLQITAALTQFLGLHGAAIPIDILKTEGAEVWIRVPAEDHSAVLAAVGGWVSGKGEGWRVKGFSSWDAGARARDSGQDLFDD